MAIVGVRELREQASEVIRRVREEHVEYVVTYQGRPVAIILPLDTGRAEAEIVAGSRKAIATSWEQYRRVADDIRRVWPSDVSTRDVIDAIRR